MSIFSSPPKCVPTRWEIAPFAELKVALTHCIFAILQFLRPQTFKASKRNSIGDGVHHASTEMTTWSPAASTLAIPHGHVDDGGNDDDHDDDRRQELRLSTRNNSCSATVSSRECAVCLESLRDGDEICTSSNADCPHMFHRACMQAWLLRQEECPCCRRSYLTFDPTDEILL